VVIRQFATILNAVKKVHHTESKADAFPFFFFAEPRSPLPSVNALPLPHSRATEPRRSARDIAATRYVQVTDSHWAHQCYAISRHTGLKSKCPSTVDPTHREYIQTKKPPFRQLTRNAKPLRIGLIRLGFPMSRCPCPEILACGVRV